MEIEEDRHLWDLWVGPESRHTTFVVVDQRGGRLSERQRATDERKTRETEREADNDRRQGDRRHREGD